jgi:hypothetical protein
MFTETKIALSFFWMDFIIIANLLGQSISLGWIVLGLIVFFWRKK